MNQVYGDRFTTLYALVHAAIVEVEEGPLPEGDAVDTLTATLLGTLAPVLDCDVPDFRG